MPNNKEDGGYTAFKGFYFQMLALLEANLKIAVEVDGDFNDVKQSQEARFGFEIDDSDGVQITGKRARIIQVKFSDKPDEKTIKPEEANEIVEKMIEFGNENFPCSQGWTHDLILLTNRVKSSIIKQFEAGQKTTLSSKIRVSKKNPNPQGNYDYSCLENNLNHLEWRLKSEFECKHYIETQAKSFGMLGNCDSGEISTGIAEVWKYFIEGVKNGDGWMNKGELLKIFVGHANPRKIHPFSDELVEEVQNSLSSFQSYSDIKVEKDDIFRRALLSDLGTAVSQSRLVIIEGEGGNGKSTLLAQFALQQANNRFVAGKYAHDLKENWPVERISSWRNRTEGNGDTVDKALRRLSSGNSGPSSIFALDATDEADLDNPVVHGLLLQLRDLPLDLRSRATLIITLRDCQDSDFFKRLSGATEICSIISIEVFSPEEITNYLKTKNPLGERVSSMLIAACQATHSQDFTEGSSVFVARPQRNAQVVTSSAFSAIRHPVIWKLFCDPSLNEDRRWKILRDDEVEWKFLALHFLDWFRKKFQKRIPGRPISVRSEALDALKEVARLYDDSSKRYYVNDWKKLLFNSPVERDLFNQCLSAGIIEADRNDFQESPKTWKWRHAFIPRYLKSLAITQEPTN